MRPPQLPVGWYAGVGSRETPPDILTVMEDIGFFMASLGWGLSSGGALGADDAFYRGAIRSPACNPATMLRIYLINRHWELYRPDPSIGLIDSTSLTEHEAEAYGIMLKARGSEHGLKEAGRLLHTRNVYQILGSDLNTPVRQVICWAEPVGTSGKVSGGTNTAVQIALQHNIPVMNLYHDTHRERALKFIEEAKQRLANQIWYG